MSKNKKLLKQAIVTAEKATAKTRPTVCWTSIRSSAAMRLTVVTDTPMLSATSPAV